MGLFAGAEPPVIVFTLPYFDRTWRRITLRLHSSTFVARLWMTSNPDAYCSSDTCVPGVSVIGIDGTFSAAEFLNVVRHCDMREVL